MSKKKSSLGGLVYSTNPNVVKPTQQDLRLWKEFHGGKPVTVIKNYVGKDAELEALAKELKVKCGTGGTAKHGEIIIQGDHRDKIQKILEEKGFRTKKAGG
jgi:translation initiation factor 1